MWLARVVFVCALPANSNPTAIPLDLSTISDPESPASLKAWLFMPLITIWLWNNS
jgi:hypothetical protein